ncbi:hypothetical protein KY285_026771 [Solanum tuberosum]|nr:hypothetical protein KY285_026771 [Solanum tuberosum]
MVKELEEYCPELTTKLIKWECPPAGWCKYNTDGASRGNPGQSSYAFCLRNDKGDMTYAEAATIQSSTSTEAEAKAILEASKHCKSTQHNHIIFQTDSLLLCKVLKGEWKIPWCISDTVEEIKFCLIGKDHKFEHIMREGNQLADYLANRAIDQGNCNFIEFGGMDIKGRKIINSDKLNCPYVRISLQRR